MSPFGQFSRTCNIGHSLSQNIKPVLSLPHVNETHSHTEFTSVY